MGASTTVILIVAILGGAALLYLARGLSSAAPTAKSDPMPEPLQDDPARALFTPGGEPPTEDQIAQARLGGPRGSQKLGSAPMTRQAGENTPPVIDDGHVA